MADFPTDLSALTDNVDDVLAKHPNNLEAKVGVDDSAVTTSLDYRSKVLMPLQSLARQAIINGGFTVNQRVYVSAATLATTVYGHDRWKAGAGGGDYSFTQLASSTQITIAAGKTLIQVIENKNVVGGTYTLSWTGTAQARSGVDSATPSGAYAASPITISSQTAGTVMSVEFDDGTLGEVQLNSGSVALPFQPKSFEEELLACQRYYEKSYSYGTAPGTATSSGRCGYDVGTATTATMTDTRLYKVTKRAAVIPKVYDLDGTIDKCYRGANGKAASIITSADSGFELSCADATSSTRIYYLWTADAEL